MPTVTVALHDAPYPIHIRQAIDIAELTAHLHGQQVLFVSHEHLAEYIPELPAPFQTARVFLPDGERHKTMAALTRIYDALMANAFNRDCTIVAVGGGVIGDVAGFAAATWQRGVAFIQMPTTLLAQVDAAIGGKTAINHTGEHAGGKNMIGAFWQPRAVLIATNTLATLPTREFNAGLAEVIKAALLYDASFIDFLEANTTAIHAKNDAILQTMIAKSAGIKAAIVAADAHEHGQRALLNLGHTFGHSIEAALNYKDWLHGEAVAAGMMMAARLSARMGHISTVDVARIARLLCAFDLPTAPPEHLTKADFLHHMQYDKKNRDDVRPLILLKRLGCAYISTDYPRADLEAVLAGTA